MVLASLLLTLIIAIISIPATFMSKERAERFRESGTFGPMTVKIAGKRIVIEFIAPAIPSDTATATLSSPYVRAATKLVALALPKDDREEWRDEYLADLTAVKVQKIHGRLYRAAYVLGMVASVWHMRRALRTTYSDALTTPRPAPTPLWASAVALLLPVSHRQRIREEWLAEAGELKAMGVSRRHCTSYVLSITWSLLPLRWALRDWPGSSS